MARSIHVIGAGLAGLAAAVKLAASGEKVILHEAAAQAGGRCRSYHDHALGIMIDNGNHLVLSGNRAALAFLRKIGSKRRLVGPPTANFPFVDLAANERWTLRLGTSQLPWWIFNSARRVPGTRPRDYLRLAKLLWAPRSATIGAVIDCSGPIYDRLLRPLLLAALNTEPREGSAGLASAVIRDTLLAGGRASRPLIARDGLSAAFIDPALSFLRSRGAVIQFEHDLRAFGLSGTRINLLKFGDADIALSADDAVILAVPFWAAASVLPQLRAPSETRAIVNAHFRVTPNPAWPPMTGVINATIEWIFVFPDRVSVTISNGDRLLDLPRDVLARKIWQEVAAVMGIAGELPAWQIVRERRATFAAIPAEDAKRPGAQTSWANLVLAGDWTDTGLPATIEGAIRSGNKAARIVAKH
jgi:hydroxysqualene dehydroxylase